MTLSPEDIEELNRLLLDIRHADAIKLIALFNKISQRERKKESDASHVANGAGTGISP